MKEGSRLWKWERSIDHLAMPIIFLLGFPCVLSNFKTLCKNFKLMAQEVTGTVFLKHLNLNISRMIMYPPIFPARIIRLCFTCLIHWFVSFSWSLYPAGSGKPVLWSLFVFLIPCWHSAAFWSFSEAWDSGRTGPCPHCPRSSCLKMFQLYFVCYYQIDLTKYIQNEMVPLPLEWKFFKKILKLGANNL